MCIVLPSIVFTNHRLKRVKMDILRKCKNKTFTRNKFIDIMNPHDSADMT